jgi:signal transduction histidine kinase
LDKIFEPFMSTKKGGTGLGLAIVKKTLDAHGGEISCCLNTKKGVTFKVGLPFSDLDIL